MQSVKKHAQDSRIRHIQALQDEIRRLIDITIYNIGRIDSGDTFDYRVLNEGTSKWTTHRAQLLRRLSSLRSHMRKLRRQRSTLRLALLESNARKVRRNNRLAARKILKEAEKRGSPTPDEEEKLVRQAEKSLQAMLGAVAANPTRRNIRGAVEALGDLMMVGGSDETTKKAMDALGKAAERRYRFKEDAFRTNPNAANLHAMVKAMVELTGMPGGDIRIPPRPAGLRVNFGEMTHTVKRGDSLQSVARKYYGSNKYWDVVYLANYGVIGNNWRYLHENIVLRIPGNKDW